MSTEVKPLNEYVFKPVVARVTSEQHQQDTTTSNEKDTIPGAILPGSDYYNAIINKVFNPGVFAPSRIYQPFSLEDIQLVLAHAQHNNFRVSILGGGHDPKGLALSGDIVIDLAKFKSIDIDVEQRLAWVEGGVLLGNLDAATVKHGLAFPGGSCHEVGVVGYILGGGFGWLTRRCGMGVDNCVAMTVVLWNGETIIASKEKNTDIFWAMRGSGWMGLGIVINVQLRLYPLQEKYVAGRIWYHDMLYENMVKLLEEIGAFCNTVDEKVTLSCFLMSKYNILALDYFFDGPPRESEEALLPFLRQVVTNNGAPDTEFSDVTKPWMEQQWTYIDYQRRYNMSPVQHNTYWTSALLKKLTKDTCSSLVDACFNAPLSPEPLCIGIEMMGCSSKMAGHTDSSFEHRDAEFVVSIQPTWLADDTNAALYKDWADRSIGALQTASIGAYPNYSFGNKGSLDEFYADKVKAIDDVIQKYDTHSRFYKQWKDADYINRV